VHALCYFHLVIQGWIKHVEKAIEKSESSQCVFEIAKRWVRTWAFDLETEVEYKDSRTRFFNWLGEQQEMTISTAGAESIRRFIIIVLDKYECMWVYHFRFQVYGMDQNTTQISEGMNWSVKSGPGGVKASMGMHTAGVALVVKGNQKAKRTQAFNEDQISRTRLWSDSGSTSMAGGVTDYAENETVKEFQISTKMKVIELEPGVYLVFYPGMWSFSFAVLHEWLLSMKWTTHT
jgi:hypothetical protein